MNDDQVKIVLNALLEHVEKGDHPEFQMLTSWSECFSILKQRRALKRVIKSLQKSQKTLLRQYCKSVIKNENEFTKLLAHSTLQNAINFFKVDFDILSDIINEFDLYAADNLLESIFIGRPEQKRWDHREK